MLLGAPRRKESVVSHLFPGFVEELVQHIIICSSEFSFWRCHLRTEMLDSVEQVLSKRLNALELADYL